MNALSFSDFESASFDSLYNRGFAGAKHCDDMAKNMKLGDFKALAGGTTGGALPMSSTQRIAAAAAVPNSRMQDTVRRSASATRALGPAPTADFSGKFHRSGQDALARVPRTVPQSQKPVPLNDIGTMPGNSRVDHSWLPSREAHAVGRHALPQPKPAPRAPSPPAGGGQRGTFVGWKSN
mmetsp:Transcript_128828/g.325139  ORF Transcript_128828/g.325139 Transcript_128828/m.325139 type:complete len:180 (+) Transcript_128828:91-630(+)